MNKFDRLYLALLLVASLGGCAHFIEPVDTGSDVWWDNVHKGF